MKKIAIILWVLLLVSCGAKQDGVVTESPASVSDSGSQIISADTYVDTEVTTIDDSYTTIDSQKVEGISEGVPADVPENEANNLFN